MGKLTKRETAFCERDALADMREAERILLHAYASAAEEGASRRLRTMLAQNFAAAVEDMYAVDCMLRQENSELMRASEEERKRVQSEFTRRGKEIAADE